jgi:hypothetical protein
MKIGKGEVKQSENIITLLTTNVTWTALELHPGLFGEKPPREHKILLLAISGDVYYILVQVLKSKADSIAVKITQLSVSLHCSIILSQFANVIALLYGTHSSTGHYDEIVESSPYTHIQFL